VQRGVLALSKFHEVLSEEEKMQTFKFAVENAPMDKDIKKGMGIIGNGLLKFAFRNVKNPDISITKKTGLEQSVEPVVYEEEPFIDPAIKKQTLVSRLFTDKNNPSNISNKSGGNIKDFVPSPDKEIPKEIISAIQAHSSLDTGRPDKSTAKSTKFKEMVSNSRKDNDKTAHLH